MKIFRVGKAFQVWACSNWNRNARQEHHCSFYETVYINKCSSEQEFVCIRIYALWKISEDSIGRIKKAQLRSLVIYDLMYFSNNKRYLQFPEMVARF